MLLPIKKLAHHKKTPYLFKVLSSFTGTASSSKMLIGIKNKQGIVAEAKANLLENAKKCAKSKIKNHRI